MLRLTRAIILVIRCPNQLDETRDWDRERALTRKMRNLQTAVCLTGPPSVIRLLPTNGRCRWTSYLPLRISCCLMFLMKWIFLKLFGRGEPERVRHLKRGAKAAAVSVGWPQSQRSNGPGPPCFWAPTYLRRGAFSSMSSSVSREER